MDCEFEHRGTTFWWHQRKAAGNERKRGVSFEEAVTVFDDPFVIISDASKRDEARELAIGFSSTGRLLAVIHVVLNDEAIRIVSARRATAAEEALYDQ